MKLTKEQFCAAVNTYKSMLEEEDNILDLFDINPEWKMGKWISAYYELLSDMCELKKDSIFGTDLDWYCYDTHFGESNSKIVDKEKDKVWYISTPEDLYDYIIENN